MTSRRLIVTVRPDGKLEAESVGAGGPACMDDLPVIEQLCDFATVVDSRLTPEYYTVATTTDALHDTQTHIVEDGER